MNSAYSALQSCACCCHFAQQTGMLLRLAVAFPAFSWLLLPELGMGGQGPISSCRSAALSSSTPLLGAPQQGELCWQRRNDEKHSSVLPPDALC